MYRAQQPLYLHTHHKCASRWTVAYLERVAALNARTFRTTDDGTDVAPMPEDIVLFGNSNYARADRAGLAGLHLVRNPLNLLLSAYHSHLSTHGLDGWPELAVQRALLERCSFEEGLYLTLVFIERADIHARAHGPFYDLRNWDYEDARFELIRVEDLTAVPSTVMKTRLCGWQLPDDDEFRFERFAGNRAPGQIDESSHYRSGAPDQWRGEIPRALQSYVASMFRPLMERGYPEVLGAIGAENENVPFYAKTEKERIALTQRAIETRQTLRNRWLALAAPESEGWNARAAKAADLLSGHRAVTDLGCGTMSLERYLVPGTTYLPVDVTRRDSRTEVCDFNVAAPPVLGGDAVACLGLLEYLFDPLAFMKALATGYRACVVSYCPTDAPSPLQPRRSHGWVNDFTKAEVEQLFCAANWIVTACEAVDGVQFIWCLHSAACGG